MNLKVLTAIFASAVAAFDLFAAFIPPPARLLHLTNSPAASPGFLRTKSALPSKYDLRDIDGNGKTFLTPVKNQLPHGTCWAFSAMACLEYLINKTENKVTDLSENNLVNTHGFGFSFNDGGNDNMSAAVILRGDAPVAERLDPYPAPGKSRTEKAVRTVKKIVFVPSRTSVSNRYQLQADLTAIKKAVLAYGPLSTSYFHSGAFASNSSYHYNGPTAANHAVTLVGWDDEYPASKFSVPPAGDGAFIIKNSWGPESGERGYIYISYYDTSLGFHGFTAYDKLSYDDEYGRLYQHDRFGFIQQNGFNSNSASFANVYTAVEDETLTAFGFYALAANTSYTAYLLLDPQMGANGQFSCSSSTKIKSGVCSDAGYEAIPFDNDVKVSKGQKFLIQVQITSPGTRYPVAICANQTFTGGAPYVTSVTAQEGLSYARASIYNAWSDISRSGMYACCKVYTKPRSENSTTKTEKPIPYPWLRLCASQKSQDCLPEWFYGSYNAYAESLGENGLSIAESFYRGVDPYNPEYTSLKATISFDKNAKPHIGAVPENKILWNYSVMGSSDLKSWHLKNDGDRFFKIIAAPGGQ